MYVFLCQNHLFDNKEDWISLKIKTNFRTSTLNNFFKLPQKLFYWYIFTLSKNGVAKEADIQVYEVRCEFVSPKWFERGNCSNPFVECLDNLNQINNNLVSFSAKNEDQQASDNSCWFLDKTKCMKELYQDIRYAAVFLPRNFTSQL